MKMKNYLQAMQKVLTNMLKQFHLENEVIGWVKGR
jgi:hypothetical protein